MFFIVVLLLVIKHPHTNMMHCFLQQTAVILPFFSICNIQYFPVFTTVDWQRSQRWTTVRGEEQCHWGQQLSFMFLCFLFMFLKCFY